jgi:hypothetical protein
MEAPPLLIKGLYACGLLDLRGGETGKDNLRLNNVENRRGMGLTLLSGNLAGMERVIRRVHMFHPSLVSFSTYELRGLSPVGRFYARIEFSEFRE